ncbi:MAG: Lrp/AsnC family transcriptional regulator [Kiritimatiellae bacterium]|nr:Lrp/AsnC family transcriptional regulator [Kiritimatiellia bacterium]
MDPILEELKKNGRESAANLAKMLGMTEEEVHRKVEGYKAAGVIRGFKAILNPNKIETTDVHAVIGLKIRPSKGSGFGDLAAQIARFKEVDSCYLMSGGYDLLLFVTGRSLQEVAHFVAADLSTLDGVLSTATHFMLRTYKEQGVNMEDAAADDARLSVSP